MSDRGFRCARVAANLMIVAVCAPVAQVLWDWLAGRAPGPAMPTALKVLTAALWVVAAVRFRSAVAAVLAPDVSPPPTERPGSEARALEDVFFNDHWLIDKADAQREPRDSRDDLEARPCRT